MKGRIHSIESMGLVDGPGIRTVVFLQGCSLRCRFCHNPDTWTLAEGERISAQELVRRIERFRPYFERSGGGVTFSGGEPLLQPDFLEEALHLCKARGIHTCLDTAGVGLGEYDAILRETDLVLYDVKHYIPEEYERLTGRSMQETERFLKAVIQNGNKLWIRHVVAPGITDGHDHLAGLRTALAAIPQVERVELLPYHKLGAQKYAALELADPWKEVPAMDVELCERLQTEFFGEDWRSL